MRKVFIAALFVFTTGCLEQTNQASKTSGSSDQVSSIVFSGASSAKNVVTGIQVNWPTISTGVIGFNIYRVENSKKVLKASVPASTSSYIDGDVLWGSVYNYIVKAVDEDGLEDANTKRVSSLSWAGISQVTAQGRESLKVQFGAAAAIVDEIRIYLEPSGGGSKTLVATASGNDLSVTLTGLKVGYAYKVSAQAYISSLGKEDGNEIEFDGRTKTYGFDDDVPLVKGYQSVYYVRAFGESPTAPVSTDMPERTPQATIVELIWPAFVGLSDPTTQYVVTRVAADREMNNQVTTACSVTTLDSCRVCKVSGAGALSCKDENVGASPARYYYAISLVQKDSSTSEEWVESFPSDSGRKFQLLVPIPPANMVLIQRDSVNYEICKLMGKSSDPTNYNRCEYTGVGATTYSTGNGKPALNLSSGYYDFGYNLFVDRFENGCNWTSAAMGGKCGAGGTSGDCFGTSTPSNSIGQPGDIYFISPYSTAGSVSRCLYKGATAWIDPFVSGTYFSTSVSSNYITNAPGTSSHHIPPIANLYVYQAAQLCEMQTDSNYGSKRLPRRREQFAYSAWPTDSGDPYYRSTTTVSMIEDSSIAYTGSQCNTYAGEHPYIPASLADILDPNNEAVDSPTVMGVAPSGVGLRLFIGSKASAECQSRYGVQDAIGNVQEYLSDEVSTYYNEGPDKYNQWLGISVSNFDSGNRDWASIKFDGNFGIGGSSWASGTTPDVTFSGSTLIRSVAVPLGLPLATTSTVYTSKSSVNLAGDSVQIYFPAASSLGATRAIIAGGTIGKVTGYGRWFINIASFNVTSDIGNTTGFRCVLPAE